MNIYLNNILAIVFLCYGLQSFAESTTSTTNLLKFDHLPSTATLALNSMTELIDKDTIEGTLAYTRSLVKTNRGSRGREVYYTHLHNRNNEITGFLEFDNNGRVINYSRRREDGNVGKVNAEGYCNKEWGDIDNNAQKIIYNKAQEQLNLLYNNKSIDLSEPLIWTEINTGEILFKWYRIYNNIPFDQQWIFMSVECVDLKCVNFSCRTIIDDIVVKIPDAPIDTSPLQHDSEQRFKNLIDNCFKEYFKENDQGWHKITLINERNIIAKSDVQTAYSESKLSTGNNINNLWVKSIEYRWKCEPDFTLRARGIQAEFIFVYSLLDGAFLKLDGFVNYIIE